MKLKNRKLARICVYFLIYSLGPLGCQAQTTLSFCDGDEIFIISEGQCEGGIIFGKRKPACVCLSGVYRSWTEECDIYDGFIHEFCTLTTDVTFNVSRIKLLKGIFDLYKDTAAIFGSDPNSHILNHEAAYVGMEGVTKSGSFYTLNGNPVILAKGQNRFICIEPIQRQGNQVCQYFSDENTDIWVDTNKDGEGFKFKIATSCDPTKVPRFRGWNLTQLKEHECYNIMNKNVSECRLSCEETTSAAPRMDLDGLTKDVIMEKKSSVSISENVQRTEDLPEELPENKPLKSSKSTVLLHRKLNKYLRMRQTSLRQGPQLSKIAPNRTFSLLGIAKQIVRVACPPAFVSDLFLDNAMDLFIFLHKAEEFHYPEDIEIRDFKWIEEILQDCRLGVIRNPPNLRGDLSTPPECENEGYLQEICTTTKGDETSCRSVNGGNLHKIGKYHFVVDTVWNIMDMTHALCLPFFWHSYRMFHVWEQATEKLFTRDIRNLWYSPTVDIRVFDALLSSNSIADMVNLERCTEAIHFTTSLSRLKRPEKLKAHLRRKRDADLKKKRKSIAKSADVFCVKKEDYSANTIC